jgi:hypothetical protein
MSESTPSITEALRQFQESRLMDVHTARIGVVRSYSSLTQRADVQPIARPAVRGESDERVVETIATLKNVPVAFLASSNSSDTFDLARGDTVLLVFCEHSLDQWLGGATGVDEPLDPGDDRMHSLSDAIAIPIRIRLPLPALPGARVMNGDDIRLGGPAATERPALLSELLALRAWIVQQFATSGGHVHQVSGSATTTIATVAVAGGVTTVPPSTPVGAQKVRVE